MTVVIAIMTFAVIGAATAAALQIPVPAAIESRVATWFLLGLGINGTLLYILGRASFAILIAAIIVLAIRSATVPVAGPPPSRRHFRRRDAGGPSGEDAGVPEVVAVAPLVVILAVSMMVPLADYDGRTTWLPKAVAIAHEHSIRGPFFQGEGGLNLHNRYPLLLPLDVATIMRNGAVDDVRPFYALIPIALVLALADSLGWLVAILAWLPPLLVFHEGGALSAYSDLAVAAFLGMAIVSVIEDRHGASLWLMFLVLTKNEGALLALAVVLASRKWRLAIGPAIGAAILTIWRMSIPDAYDERYGVLLRHMQPRRIPEAISALATHAAGFATWGLFWIAVVVAIVIAIARKRPMFATAVVLLAVAGYTLAFSATSWSIADLAKVSADRLLLQITIPALFVLREAAQ